MTRLTDKIAVVTGAASGVGRATAIRFASEGASVVATDLNEEGLISLGEEIPADRLLTQVMDVSDQDAIARTFAATKDRFGVLDILVNNAGMSSSAGMDPSVDVWEKGIDVTLSSAYWMSKAAVGQMAEKGSGAIVNIASLAGNTMGTPVSWYCSAKAGLIGLTRSFATTYGGKGIRTNAVCLGAIETPRLQDILTKMPGQKDIHDARSPIGRMGQPEEIAACALFLASDEASFVNGHAMVADGGFSLA